MQHLLTLKNWTPTEILEVLDLADQIKGNPEEFTETMTGRTLLMLFEKPSLRTRVSFEVGLNQMGGHAVYYDATNSPLGMGKESVPDTARVAGRFVDLIAARLYNHAVLEELAVHAGVPVINALTDISHPCQILADLQTIREKKGKLAGLRLAYLGDAENNVTYSLMIGCAKMGMHISIGCPEDETYKPDESQIRETETAFDAMGGSLRIFHDAKEAVSGADIVYTDSWMSYHIPQAEMEGRVEALSPFQVNGDVMAVAQENAIFMNCLPAMRGYEQTAAVIDGAQSVVFDEAENRLYAQKAVMVILGK